MLHACLRFNVTEKHVTKISVKTNFRKIKVKRAETLMHKCVLVFMVYSQFSKRLNFKEQKPCCSGVNVFSLQ